MTATPLPPGAEPGIGGFDPEDGQRLITAHVAVDGLPANMWVALWVNQYGNGALALDSFDITIDEAALSVPDATALAASILAAVELSEQWAAWSADLTAGPT